MFGLEGLPGREDWEAALGEMWDLCSEHGNIPMAAASAYLALCMCPCC